MAQLVGGLRCGKALVSGPYHPNRTAGAGESGGLPTAQAMVLPMATVGSTGRPFRGRTPPTYFPLRSVRGGISFSH